MKAKVVVNVKTTSPGALNGAHLADQPLVAGAVLLGRPLTQQVRVEEPDREVENGADDEEGNVQVRRLALNIGVVQRLGPRPRVQSADAEQNRDQKQRHEGQRSRSGLAQAPDQHAPFPADHMMHQQNGQAAERHAGPVEIGEKIGAEELLAVEQQREDRQQHVRHAHQQRISLPSADPRGNGIRRCHGVFSSVGTLVRRHILDFGVLAELQNADVSGDAPPIVRLNARRIAGHGAEAVGHHVKKMSHRRFDQLVGVIGRRLAEAAPHDHSVAVADPAVARRAVDVEALLAAQQVRPGDGERKFSRRPCRLSLPV